jgi:hypothetical protein
MPDYLGLVLQLTGLRPSQYGNYNFNSMCKFGDTYLGANESGIFEIDSTEFDNTADGTGDDIESFFELLTTDFGIANPKRIRSLYFGYEADGNLLITVYDDDNNERHYILEPNHIPNKQSSAKVSIGRDGKGRYYTFRIDNISGADFSIDNIEVVPVILNRKPSGA